MIYILLFSESFYRFLLFVQTYANHKNTVAGFNNQLMFFRGVGDIINEVYAYMSSNQMICTRLKLWLVAKEIAEPCLVCLNNFYILELQCPTGPLFSAPMQNHDNSKLADNEVFIKLLGITWAVSMINMCIYVSEFGKDHSWSELQIIRIHNLEHIWTIQIYIDIY